MPSFDIVSEINIQEIDNAVNQAAKEIGSRFDFRNGSSEITLDKEKKTLKIIADDEMKLRSIHQILENKVAKRKLDCRILQYQDEEEASGNLIKQMVQIKSGLTKEEAKSITKEIKASKHKVQAQVQDEQVRVTGKKIDDLQEIISILKNAELDLPLQYINMRS